MDWEKCSRPMGHWEKLTWFLDFARAHTLRLLQYVPWNSPKSKFQKLKLNLILKQSHFFFFSGREGKVYLRNKSCKGNRVVNWYLDVGLRGFPAHHSRLNHPDAFSSTVSCSSLLFGAKRFLVRCLWTSVCFTRCSVTLGIALVGQMTFPNKLRSVVHVIDTCHCCVSFSLGSGQAFWGCPEDMPRVNHVSDERFILFHHPAPGRPTQPKRCQLRLYSSHSHSYWINWNGVFNKWTNV